MAGVIRTLARNRAKNNCKKRGMVKICKKNRNRESWFSKNWRDWVIVKVEKKRRKKV